MKRREFIMKAGTAVLATPLFLKAAACGDDKDDADNKDCTNGASATTISANHGHSLSLTAAEVAKTSDETFNIEGTSTHAHQITLTAAQLATIRAGNTVTVTSTNDNGHTHQVTVSC